MLINTIDEEESRMAVVEDGNLVEYNVRMPVREPTAGNIYNATVQKCAAGTESGLCGLWRRQKRLPAVA